MVGELLDRWLQFSKALDEIDGIQETYRHAVAASSPIAAPSSLEAQSTSLSFISRGMRYHRFGHLFLASQLQSGGSDSGGIAKNSADPRDGNS